MLIERSEQPVTKQELLAAVWGTKARSQNVVEANVSSLRQKAPCARAAGDPHAASSGVIFRPVRSSA